MKEAVFPFARFPGVDTLLGPEMRSTGEVMGLDWVRPGEAVRRRLRPRLRQEPARRRHGACRCPGAAFISVKDADKPWIVEPARVLSAAGHYRIVCHRAAPPTSFEARGTARSRSDQEGAGGPPQHRRFAMKNGDIQLVFNTTEGNQSVQDSYSLRRSALMMKIPYYTTAAGALAAAQAIEALANGELEVRPLQSYG